jgi:cellulase
MQYLGAWPTPDKKPQAVQFFKIYELGYDKMRKKWANEDIIADGYKNTIQIPSDIKPGTYILRTDLLSLHGNGRIDGPQFYTHCFNVEVLGDGTVSPPGVTFPGGYKANEPGVIQRLSGNAGENYVGYISLRALSHTDTEMIYR